MGERYQVPKDRTRVTLHPPGVETEVFLSRTARLHGGRETISDLLADPAPFLPAHPDSGFSVFRKDCLDWVLVHDPLEAEEAFVETSGIAHRLPARLTFEDGSSLEGSFVFVAPESASRLSDLANSERTWIHFEDETGHYLVNLTRATRIDALASGKSREPEP